MINIEEIKEKLIDKLKSSGWASVLKGFIYSSDFVKIIEDLEKEVNDGKRFTPVLKDVFTAFEESKWEDLRVVMIGQDSYPTLGVADGLAFSCSKTNKEQPSLRYMRDAIQRTVYDPIPEPRQTDLRYLANQGVLLINTALTTQIDKPMTHQKIWSAFIAYTLDTISNNKKHVVFVFLGKEAASLEGLVSDSHTKYIISHPMSAGYTNQLEWDCKDVFNKVNESLEQNKVTPIKW